MSRRERYDEKLKVAKVRNVHVGLVAFADDQNVGFAVRAAACYGAKAVHVIGSMPAYDDLRRLSGSTNHYVRMVQHAGPYQFLDFCRSAKMRLISAELSEGAVPLPEVSFDSDEETMIVSGNETTGVPVDILLNSEKVYIPMPGVGFCLNTAQTLNAFLYEYNRQVGF